MEIKELRKRLEEIQNMDSIEDLTDEVLLANFPSENLKEAQEGLGLSEDWARDIDMAQGMEKDKIQELSETVDYQRRGELEQEIVNIRENRIVTEEKLRKAWLQAQRKQEKQARGQMKEKAKQAFIKELGEIKAELQAEVQANDENTSRQVASKRAEIAELNTKIAEIDEERKSILAIVAENKAVLALKSEDSQVYQVAKRESNNCVRKARRRVNKMKEMNAKIESLQGEIQQLEEQGKRQEEMLQGQLASVDEIFYTIDQDRRDERIRKEQEDEMWREYREEQKKERLAQEERRDKDVDRGLEEKRLGEEKEEERIAKETTKEVEVYGEGLNPEETIEFEQPTSQKPLQTSRTQAATGQIKPPKQEPKLDKWKVESVTFSIEGGSNPVYKAIVSNGKEKREYTSKEIVILDEEFDSDEIKMLTQKGRDSGIVTYYDKGMATLLEQIDVDLGTDSLKQYQKLLNEREMLLRYPERYKDYMKIGYDFSELKGKVSKEMKQLQKIAKKCGTKGAVVYQKRPNIFQRIWRSLTSNVQLLKETPLEYNVSEEELRAASMRGKMEEGIEDRPYEFDIDALKGYPEFSPEVAKEQLEESMETVEEKVHLDDVIDAAKAWRKAQHIEKPVVNPEDLEKDDENGPKKHEQEIEM